MKIELTGKEFRHLLDLVYIGNWVLNSRRGDDRFQAYDQVESKVFSLCAQAGMAALAEQQDGNTVPSQAFSEGGIHEAIMDYEDSVFFDILAEELAHRDMGHEPINDENYNEFMSRIDAYMDEFEANGAERLQVCDDMETDSD